MAVRVLVAVFFAEHGCLWIREKVVAWFFVCCGTKLWLSFFSAECLSATGLGCGLVVVLAVLISFCHRTCLSATGFPATCLFLHVSQETCIITLLRPP